jgi:probable F420-dependent oxidoreductase
LTQRPFRFLGEISGVIDARALAEQARKAESLGYSMVVRSDHLLDQLAPVPAMAVIANATQRLRVGTFVFNNDLHHPAVLAQDLASLDVLSGGRLEVGIGAGWNRPEYVAAGIPFDSGKARVERMQEAVAVLKGLFGDGPFSFSGKHYEISEMDGRPKPVQRPHPPFLIGGGGRRLLSFAAREADVVGLAPRIGPDGRGDVASVLLEATAEKIEWIRAAAGDRLDDLEINTYPAVGRVTVTDDAGKAARELAARLKERSGRDFSVEDVLGSPHVFIGSIADLEQKFRDLRERFGISCIMTGGLDELAPLVERMAGS